MQVKGNILEAEAHREWGKRTMKIQDVPAQKRFAVPVAEGHPSRFLELPQIR